MLPYEAKETLQMGLKMGRCQGDGGGGGAWYNHEGPLEDRGVGGRGSDSEETRCYKQDGAGSVLLPVGATEGP